MNFKYENLSPGYVGLPSSHATLNSTYYSLLFEDNFEESSHLYVFPQRTPRIKFFHELVRLESEYFKTDFNKIKLNLLTRVESCVRNTFQSDSSIKCILNVGNLLLRFGCAAEINRWNMSDCIKNEELRFEFLYLKELAKLELALDSNKLDKFNSLLELCDQAANNTHISGLLKMRIYNRLIVTSCRYKLVIAPNKFKEILSTLILLLESNTNLDFYATLLKSVIARGLAMSNFFSSKEKERYLAIAQEMAEQGISNANTWNFILASENLYTFRQTFSKWYLQKNDMKNAEEQLLNMIEIDPYDSTGYSELGFFYLKIKNFELAYNMFEKAYILGPPAVGMNMYYLAQCQKKLGKWSDYIHTLRQVLTVDENAISPYLELLQFYLSHHEIEDTKKIAKYILETKVLYDQLTESELLHIKAIIN